MKAITLRELMASCAGQRNHSNRMVLYRMLQNIYKRRQDYAKAAFFRDRAEHGEQMTRAKGK